VTSAAQAYRMVRRISGDPSSMLFAAQLCVAGCALLANILAARVLGPAGRGELALLLQIGYFGSLGVVLGCDRSVVAVYSGRSLGSTVRVALSLLARPSLAALLGAGIILALPVEIIESWRVRLALAALFVITNSLARMVRAIAITTARTRQYLAFELTQGALLLLGLGVLTLLDRTSSALWLLAYLLAGGVATASWLVCWSRSSAGPAGDSGPPDARRAARREGLQLVPATLAHSGTLRLDRLVLVALASTEALGLYATVATMTELIAWPIQAFADSRLGVWRRAYDRGTLSLRPVLWAATAYSALAVLVVVVVVHWLLVPLFGPAYAASAGLVLPLALAAAAYGISQLLVAALTSVHHPKLSSMTEMVGLAVSAVAYPVLISRFGPLGAACGSLVAYTACLMFAGVLLAACRRANRPAFGPRRRRGGQS
jgi:O-antigen/teichoic acid export membrane protein